MTEDPKMGIASDPPRSTSRTDGPVAQIATADAT